MKRFLIFLAIGLAASDKLDRTYLPPPGAQFAGGNPGDISLPLPHPSHSLGIGHTGHEESQNFGLNGEPLNFGDKIPQGPLNYYTDKVPTTTTSYAFSQTTTYPRGEITGTTPINPVTGLPIVDQGPSNYPYGQNIQYLPSYTPAQSQGKPTFGTIAQPGFDPQGQVSTPVTYGNPNYGQPGFLNQYPEQNVVIPGNVNQIPGGNQLSQYPGGETIRQQGFVPSPASFQGAPINLQPGSNQYGVNYDNPKALIPQGTYSGQPIQILGESQPNQGTYQNQVPINVGEPQQYPAGNQNLILSGQPGSGELYQPGSTIPSSYYNGISGTTPVPSVPSSTSAYSSGGPVYRPERPQAAADRNAVILNYENIRTPNGYSYSFDTSNGIHADESGIVDNGTKAQGAYSYIGDDGKVYSVTYTADENGFQPRGDHLPTPPPIPEAIQKVIEQAARDKAAGIFDDGSYDEAKYGDIKYHSTDRRPQHQGKSKPPVRVQDSQVIPIAGINDAQYDDVSSLGQFDNNLSTTGSKRPSGKRPPSSSITQTNAEFDVMSEDKNNVPISDKNKFNNANNLGAKIRGPSESQPTSSYNKNMNIKYPGSLVDVVDDLLNSERDKFDDRDQEIESGSPNFSDGSNKYKPTEFDSVTGAPKTTGNRNQITNQIPKGNRRPGAIKNKIYNHNKGTQSKVQNNTPSISDYRKNGVEQADSNPQTQQDNTGYHYQAPGSNKFPSRFSPYEESYIKPDQHRTEFGQGTIRKPFITPNVYNQNDRTHQSTTRRPFTTVDVTSPIENSYTDYDDGDYGTDQDIDDEKVDSIRVPAKTGTSRPYQPNKTTSIPKYTSDGRNDRIKQEESLAPGLRFEHSGTETPGYKYDSTTPMPTHTTRFGSTETPQKNNAQQQGPSYTPTTIISQSPQEPQTLKYKYQSTAPILGTNGYSPIGVKGFDLSSNPQGYSTSTNRPVSLLPGTTVLPTTRYQTGVSSLSPSGIPGISPTEIFQTGYHYGPPKIEFSTPGTISPNSPSGTYQTTYPGSSYSNVIPVSSTPGTFVLSQNGNIAPNYPGHGLSTPDYSTTIVSSTPGSRPTLGGTGYEYGSTSSPTISPSTIGTTPGFISSATPTMPSQSYSNTPAFQTTKDGYIGGPVDGFGRPIIDSGYKSPNQSSTGPNYQVPGFNGVQGGTLSTGPNTGSNSLLGNGPVNNVAPGTGQTIYPGSYDQPNVIGEDFTGSKQPQRFDPKTGYHYK